MKILLAGVCGILLLTGCAVMNDVEEGINSIFTVPPPKHERLIKNYGTTCESLGFKPGTESFANCLLKLDANAAARSR